MKLFLKVRKYWWNSSLKLGGESFRKNGRSERLSGSPVLSTCGCSHHTAQETASSAVPILSQGRENYFLVGGG